MSSYYGYYSYYPTTANAASIAVSSEIKSSSSSEINESSGADTNAEGSSALTSFFARRRFTSGSAVNSTAARTASDVGETDHDLLSFLAVAQTNEVDFLPVTWQSDLGRVGAGGTANIQQSFLNQKLSYVFKRIHRGIDEPYAYKALVSEISILGHKDIRGHPNIVRLAGISWDVLSTVEPIWPALVFQKSEHGDLKHFMKSEAGVSMDFDAKMKLCDDIAVGITALHDINIVHGDIKPMNVLVFPEQGEADGTEIKYIAKIGDFGYSTLKEQQVGEDIEDGIQVPISRPWNAPEISNWPTRLSIQGAKLTDVFSFSLVALWLLFKDRLLEMGIDVEKPVADPEWKRENRLKELVSEVVAKQEGLLEPQRDSIKTFFLSTLVENPEAREPDMRGLMTKFTAVAPVGLENGGYSTYDRWVLYQKYPANMNHKDFDPSSVQEAYKSHWSGVQNPYNYWNPYHPVNIYTSPLSKGYYSNKELYPDVTRARGSHFLIYRSFRQLALGDYRVWKHIFDTLKTRASDRNILVTDRNQAAFQLAFCYEMGFGTPPDADRVASYLSQSGQSKATLNHEIQRIREDKQRDELMYKKLEGEIAMIDHIGHYLKTEELGDVQAAYIPSAQAVNSRLGEDHPISVNMNKIVAASFIVAGDIDKAETLYTRLFSVCEEFYGPRHRYTLEILQRLAECSEKRGDLEKAEEIQQRVLNDHDSRLGPNSTVHAMIRLAIIAGEKKDWTKAAELQEGIIKIHEKEYGRTHKDTVATMLHLTGSLTKQGLWSQAEEVATDALARAEGSGDQNENILDALDLLSTIYEEGGNWEKGIENLHKAIEIKKTSLGLEHERSLNDIRALARAHTYQGNFEKATEVQTLVVEADKRTLGISDTGTLSGMEFLASLLELTGKYEEAAAIMADVVSQKIELLGLEHTSTIDSKQTLEDYQEKAKKARGRDRLLAFIAKLQNANADWKQNQGLGDNGGEDEN